MDEYIVAIPLVQNIQEKYLTDTRVTIKNFKNISKCERFRK